jgi:hypothetical protein
VSDLGMLATNFNRPLDLPRASGGVGAAAAPVSSGTPSPANRSTPRHGGRPRGRTVRPGDRPRPDWPALRSALAGTAAAAADELEDELLG